MKGYLIPVASAATVIALTLAAEQQAPGITIVTALVVAKVATGLLSAAVYPLAAFGFGWLMWQGGKAVGQRDALQEVAAATTKKRLRESIPSTRQQPSNN